MTLNKLMNTPTNSPVISEKKRYGYVEHSSGAVSIAGDRG